MSFDGHVELTTRMRKEEENLEGAERFIYACARDLAPLSTCATSFPDDATGITILSRRCNFVLEKQTLPTKDRSSRKLT